MQPNRNTKFILLACLQLAGIFVAHAQTVKLFAENKQGSAIIYATNNELCPASVRLRLKLTNMRFSENGKDVFVIPPKSEKVKLGELTMGSPGTYRYSYDYQTALGDVTATPDRDYPYALPFPKGKTYKLVQGYNGASSHQNENALDFDMPQGSEIAAAREGLVVQVVQSNVTSCPQEDCRKYNNYVTVMHPDGSFAHYAHIQTNGARVKPGDSVKKGDILALSGNVGYSTGPHLHFVCYVPGFEKWATIGTQFQVEDGKKTTYLQEGKSYSRQY